MDTGTARTVMRDTLQFFLEEWLNVASLFSRPRFADHSLDTLRSALDTCDRIAAEKFAPFNRRIDLEEPRLKGDRVVLPECSYEAARAYVRSGMLAASQDYDHGGMQLPYVAELAANMLFAKSGLGFTGGHLLTVGNANLLMNHGTDRQRRIFASNEFNGRWFGTMCLSETQAGSSLSDILTRALPDGPKGDTDPLGPRYRLFGSKMWISNGDHEISENIVHLVLAKIANETAQLTPGTRDISLFVVPKHLVDEDGRLTGERNDVAVAGLNHKLGYRGLPNALLNFGEGRYPCRGAPGAIGYRVGHPGEGLHCMFHMMNEARITVGSGAAATAYAGFEASLSYARERRQGRAVRPQGKDARSAPIPIIEHADVRRMLLAQKAYSEGAIALILYCARLVDEMRTGQADAARDASLLLELLTPIAKSWPSEWGVEANSLAIQVLGGYGYTRDFPVEQYWRDNRLNMIHEGTHGIQALDLLGRKIQWERGVAYELLKERIESTAYKAREMPGFRKQGEQLSEAILALQKASQAALDTPDPQEALANATPFLQAMGHTVVAWLWLDIAMVARSGNAQLRASGKAQTMRYFFAYELPKVSAWLQAVHGRERTCLDMQSDWFDQ